MGGERRRKIGEGGKEQEEPLFFEVSSLSTNLSSFFFKFKGLLGGKNHNSDVTLFFFRFFFSFLWSESFLCLFQQNKK